MSCFFFFVDTQVVRVFTCIQRFVGKVCFYSNVKFRIPMFCFDFSSFSYSNSIQVRYKTECFLSTSFVCRYWKALTSFCFSELISLLRDRCSCSNNSAMNTKRYNVLNDVTGRIFPNKPRLESRSRKKNQLTDSYYFLEFFTFCL